jgi:hypothetical protein
MNESLERQSLALLDPVVSVGWLSDEVRQAMAAIGIPKVWSVATTSRSSSAVSVTSRRSSSTPRS